MTNLLEAALKCASRGWHILPLHWPVNGHCSCENLECHSPAKHPLTKNGLNDATIDPKIIREWWAKWPEANFGIRTGAVSGFVVLDIDPRHGGDESLIALEMKHGELPHTVESLTGGRGRHIFFQHPGGDFPNRVKAFGLSGIDIRGDGGYIVASPSKHISGKSYEWEVSAHPDDTQLAELPKWLLNIPRDRTQKNHAGNEEPSIREEERNNFLTSLAGTMRRRGMTEKAILAALLETNSSQCNPSLDEEEVKKIAESVSRYEPAKNSSSNSKGESQAKCLVSLALSKLELFHDERGEPYAAIFFYDGRRIISLGSKDFSRWLSQLAWKQLGKAVGSEIISTTRQTLSGIARFEKEEKTLHNRVALQDGAIWIDFDGQKAICVKPGQWSLVANPPILFRSSPHQKSMPIPVPGGDPWQVFDFLNIKQDPSQLFFLCYLVASLVPDIPVVVLILHGQQGSAKTTIMKIIKRLLDPSIVEVRGGISDQTEFAQFAFQNRILFFDNLTKLPEWLSDCLCRTVSGEGWSKRSLFTDEDTTVFAYQRIVGLAGINLVAEKSDLLERSIIISLEAISPERRRDEETFWQDFNAKKGEILGGLLDALSKAYQIKPSLTLKNLPRMADFTRWGCAASIGLGKTSKDFLEAFKQNVGFQNEAAIEASLIAQVFLKFMEGKQDWKGPPGDLLGEFDKVAETLKINIRTKGWPKNPSWFSRRLKEVTPNLTSLGFEIEENRSPKKREISIRKLGENGVTGDMPSQKASNNAQNDNRNGNDTNDSKIPFEPEGYSGDPDDDDTGEFCEVEDMFDPSGWAESQTREPGEEG